MTLRPEQPPTEPPPQRHEALAAASDPERSLFRGRGVMLLLGGLLLGYAALSYYSNSASAAKGLGVALSIGPLLLIGAVLLFRWAGWPATVFVMGIAAALLYHYFSALEKNYEWLDLLQQCGVYGLVAAGFARSLLPGQVPLCTQLAIKMHGELAPVEVRYTRRATIAWLTFYMAMIAAIVVLFVAAPLRIWSLFVNFATYGLILLMGLGDHWWRGKVLPPRPSGGLLSVIQRTLIG